jgi:hypothetical protein
VVRSWGSDGPEAIGRGPPARSFLEGQPQVPSPTGLIFPTMPTAATAALRSALPGPAEGSSAAPAGGVSFLFDVANDGRNVYAVRLPGRALTAESRSAGLWTKLRRLRRRTQRGEPPPITESAPHQLDLAGNEAEGLGRSRPIFDQGRGQCRMIATRRHGRRRLSLSSFPSRRGGARSLPSRSAERAHWSVRECGSPRFTPCVRRDPSRAAFTGPPPRAQREDRAPRQSAQGHRPYRAGRWP